jgi:hypothetical protein
MFPEPGPRDLARFCRSSSRAYYIGTDKLELLTRNIIGGCDAFDVIGQEYQLDPNEVLRNYPFVETMKIGEAIASIGTNEITDELKAGIDEYTQDTITAYRAAIADYSDGWE